MIWSTKLWSMPTNIKQSTYLNSFQRWFSFDFDIFSLLYYREISESQTLEHVAAPPKKNKHNAAVDSGKEKKNHKRWHQLQLKTQYIMLLLIVF